MYKNVKLEPNMSMKNIGVGQTVRLRPCDLNLLPNYEILNLPNGWSQRVYYFKADNNKPLIQFFYVFPDNDAIDWKSDEFENFLLQPMRTLSREKPSYGEYLKELYLKELHQLVDRLYDAINVACAKERGTLLPSSPSKDYSYAWNVKGSTSRFLGSPRFPHENLLYIECDGNELDAISVVKDYDYGQFVGRDEAPEPKTVFIRPACQEEVESWMIREIRGVVFPSLYVKASPYIQSEINASSCGKFRYGIIELVEISESRLNPGKKTITAYSVAELNFNLTKISLLREI